MNFPLPAIGIVGLGLIGASLARAVKQRGLAEQIIGADISEETLRYCQQQHIVDAVMPLEALAGRCDLIILAVPPGAIGSAIGTLAPHLQEHAALTDVASVKLPVLRYLEQNYPSGIAFIPGHPIAGGTDSGPQTADAEIFTRKLVVLTPPQGIEIDDPALQRVRDFWQHLDAVVELMPADLHDMIYGYISHLPHLMAYAAAATLADAGFGHSPPDTLRRFLRLGDSDPGLWCDILLNNQMPALQALHTYIAMLSHIRDELTQGETNESHSHESGDISEKDPRFRGDDSVAVHTLFPRIAASCLIATVTMLERQAGQKLARYSGSGFADVVSPAAETPESDMENISTHYRAVGRLLERYEKHLQSLAAALEGNQPKQLHSQLSDMQGAYRQIQERLAG